MASGVSGLPRGAVDDVDSDFDVEILPELILHELGSQTVTTGGQECDFGQALSVWVAGFRQQLLRLDGVELILLPDGSVVSRHARGYPTGGGDTRALKHSFD